MTDTHSEAFEDLGGIVVVEEHVAFTLTDLCRVSGGPREQVLALVDEGLLEPAGSGPEDWRFSGQALATARTALRLARELHLDLQGVAVVMDLMNEIGSLRAQLRRLRG